MRCLVSSFLKETFVEVAISSSLDLHCKQETDTAEAAVAKLFAFAKKDGSYDPFSQCLQHLPPESQMQVSIRHHIPYSLSRKFCFC